MTPEELGARLVARVGAGEPSVSAGGAFARAAVDVPAAVWVAAATAARDDLDLTYFDWLTAVDEDEDGFRVVAHLWAPAARYGVLLRVAVPRDDPRLATLTGVYAGADWHERETAEMFGLVFEGHPNPRKLLLSDEFAGHPLRKDFVLASRVAKAWPGAKEPGESESGAPSRRRVRPPGVPDPAAWGPDAGEAPADGEAPARARPARGDRPVRPPRRDGPPTRPTRPATTADAADADPRAGGPGSAGGADVAPPPEADA